MARQIDIERIQSVAVVRLNRPPVNAFDLPFTCELETALTQIDTEEVGAIVLTGTGDCFSAGLDLKVVPGYDKQEQKDMIVAMGRMLGILYGHRRPTIAAVNGHAVAAGTLLSLACDYRVGPLGDYRFGLTGAQVGIPYPTAAQAIIQNELDPSTCRVMLLGAERFGPDVALERGVLDELVQSGDVMERALEIAHQRSALPAESYGQIKQRLRATALRRIREANEAGGDPFLEGWMTAESARASAQALARPDAATEPSGQ